MLWVLDQIKVLLVGGILDIHFGLYARTQKLKPDSKF